MRINWPPTHPVLDMANYRTKLALQLKPVIEAKAKEKQREGGGAVRQKSDKPEIDTKKEVAKLAQLSHDTIHKMEVIEKKAPEEIKHRVLKGELSINKGRFQPCVSDVKRNVQHQLSPGGFFNIFLQPQPFFLALASSRFWAGTLER